jgi:hypothetical protein
MNGLSPPRSSSRTREFPHPAFRVTCIAVLAGEDVGDAHIDNPPYARGGHAEEALTWTRAVMTKLGLTLNRNQSERACLMRLFIDFRQVADLRLLKRAHQSQGCLLHRNYAGSTPDFRRGLAPDLKESNHSFSAFLFHSKGGAREPEQQIVEAHRYFVARLRVRSPRNWWICQRS